MKDMKNTVNSNTCRSIGKLFIAVFMGIGSFARFIVTGFLGGMWDFLGWEICRVTVSLERFIINRLFGNLA